jgi:hypothetical protein
MMAGLRSYARCLAVLAMLVPTLSQAAIWQDLDAADSLARPAASVSLYYRPLKADAAQLRQALAAAPLELTSSQGSTLTLPLPDGSNGRFEVEESPVMSPALAASYPNIHTYRVRGIDDPTMSGRLDMTPAGFHAMLDSPGGTIFIDPDDSGNYRSFYKQDYARAVGASAERICQVSGAGSDVTSLPTLAQRTLVSQTQRRIYRLAIAVTGEYAGYFKGSESAIVANVTTTINRVNQVYGRDLAVQLQLAYVVIYTDAASDPYSNPGATTTTLDENQKALDHEVGAGNYDIGHLFSLADGGYANVGVTCTNLKARGYTGYPVPDSDVFYIDFVAHEMGHQLSALHTFNGTTGACGSINRVGETAVEPGSGSTIMAYAGICSDNSGSENLQRNSDATFHAESIDEIHNYVFAGNGSHCGTLVNTGDALPARVDAGVDRTIPKETPFILSGDVSDDPDGDTLSYQWDEMDAGGKDGGTDSTTFGTDLGPTANNPLFRSFMPKNTPTRYFPRLSTLISAATDKAETLPTTQRRLNFRLTVRDGNAGVVNDDVVVTVDNTQGPFATTDSTLNNPLDYPPHTGAFSGEHLQELKWVYKGTETDCPMLSVSLLSISSDGSTYCDSNDDSRLFIGNTANDGSESVMLPAVQITRARVMLACADNRFFDISDHDFSVNAPANPIASDCKTIDGDAVENGSVTTPPSTEIKQVGGGGGGGGGLFWLPLLLGLGGLFQRPGRKPTRAARLR